MNYHKGEVAGSDNSLVAAPEPSEFKPNKLVILTALTLGRMFLHPEVHFEENAEDEILEHKANGGSFYILMTHFNRVEPLLMLPLVAKEKSLKHFRYTTRPAAREEMWDTLGLGTVLRSLDAIKLRRSTEHENETPEERRVRQDGNQQGMAVVGRHLVRYSSLIWPEGTSRITVVEDGETKRKKRDSKTLLPIRDGFVYALEAMTEEERQNVRLVAITSHFGSRFLGLMRSTVYVRKPAEIVKGTHADTLAQGEDLLRGGVEQVIRLDAQRR